MKKEIKKENKKGQITLFILIGMAVLIAVFFIWYIRSAEKEPSEVERISKVPAKFVPVKNYVEACIENVALPGIYMLGSKGGYIYSYNKTLDARFGQIAYHLELVMDVSPSKEFMERELSAFIADSLPICLDGLSSFPYYNFSFGKIKADARITKDAVPVVIDYPITIFEGDSKTTISDFRAAIPIRLGYILDIKSSIISHIKDNALVDLGFLSSKDVEIDLLPYDKHTYIYAILDNSSNLSKAPFAFKFAVKGDGNAGPRLDFIPDFVLTRGKLFVYDVNATDPDGDRLSFYTANNLLPIDAVSGIISFTPSTAGEYREEVCVSDRFLAKDCKPILLRVENE